jgi:pimeloyl-ACP methyl ester carboxylesterase
MRGRGVSLHVARAGPADGPLVILLHGFPDFWYGWRRQIGPLAAAGYCVLAPDQRGYHFSEKPRDVRAYALDELAGDVVALIEASGRTSAVLVGHDWGGVVAWHVATRHPDRVDRLAILNAPHPAVILRHLWTRPTQTLRSWYVFALQVPWLPELGLRGFGGRPLAELLRRTSRPGTFSDDDLAQYRRAWEQPGAMRAMVNWYRAGLRSPSGQPPRPRVRAPVLILWGVKDPALSTDLARASLALCDQGRLEFYDDASHWLPHEEPERINRRLLAFFRPDDPAGTSSGTEIHHASGGP